MAGRRRGRTRRSCWNGRTPSSARAPWTWAGDDALQRSDVVGARSRGRVAGHTASWRGRSPSPKGRTSREVSGMAETSENAHGRPERSAAAAAPHAALIDEQHVGLDSVSIVACEVVAWRRRALPNWRSPDVARSSACGPSSRRARRTAAMGGPASRAPASRPTGAASRRRRCRSSRHVVAAVRDSSSRVRRRRSRRPGHRVDVGEDVGIERPSLRRFRPAGCLGRPPAGSAKSRPSW